MSIASCMTGKSDSLPIMIPTFAILFSNYR